MGNFPSGSLRGVSGFIVRLECWALMRDCDLHSQPQRPYQYVAGVRDWRDGASSRSGDASTRATTETKISHLFSESGCLIGFFFRHRIRGWLAAGSGLHEFQFSCANTCNRIRHRSPVFIWLVETTPAGTVAHRLINNSKIGQYLNYLLGTTKQEDSDNAGLTGP